MFSGDEVFGRFVGCWFFSTEKSRKMVSLNSLDSHESENFENRRTDVKKKKRMTVKSHTKMGLEEVKGVREFVKFVRTREEFRRRSLVKTELRR